MLAYFIVLNDYGFSPESLFFLAQEHGQTPRDTDAFQAHLHSRGNFFYFDVNKDKIDYLRDDPTYDLRIFYIFYGYEEWTE